MGVIHGITAEDEDTYTDGIAPETRQMSQKRGRAIHRLINKSTASLGLLFVL